MAQSRLTLTSLLWLSSLCAFPLSAEAVDNDSPITVDWTGYADLRIGSAKGGKSWTDFGLDKARYGTGAPAKAFVDVAELAVMADVKIGWDWSAFMHVAYQGELSHTPDLIEAFIAYKPAPQGRLSWSGRLGHMFPHMSRENVGVAWTSPYSITPSAINSWIGEEIKTTGLEASLHIALDRGDSLSLTASGFMLNDTAGTLLHFRGWALHDVKVGAFSRLPLPRVPSIYGSAVSDNPIFDPALFAKQAWQTVPVIELDNRPGYYVTLDYKQRRGLKAGIAYYDNRGNPNILRNGQYGWGTDFINAYIEYEFDSGLSLISQYMDGDTAMGPWQNGDYPAKTSYRSAFLLASQKLGDFRISARGDWFKTKDLNNLAIDNNNETGYSAMLAGAYSVNQKLTVMSEILYVDADRAVRSDIGLDPSWQSTQIQLSLRLAF